jgi:hypothetical protein
VKKMAKYLTQSDTLIFPPDTRKWKIKSVKHLQGMLAYPIEVTTDGKGILHFTMNEMLTVGD